MLDLQRERKLSVRELQSSQARAHGEVQHRRGSGGVGVATDGDRRAGTHDYSRYADFRPRSKEPMSTYVRAAQKTTVHCTFAGCKWVRTYFHDPTKMSHVARAEHGLNA